MVGQTQYFILAAGFTFTPQNDVQSVKCAAAMIGCLFSQGESAAVGLLQSGENTTVPGYRLLIYVGHMSIEYKLSFELRVEEEKICL